jgi:poly(hydroxyalkanoate) depolymerase family esterase
MKPNFGKNTVGPIKTMRHQLFLWAVAGAILIAAAAHAGQLEDRDFNPGEYPNSDHRDFYVYVPDAYDGNTPLPMVMVLHGCHQTRDTVFDEFGWDEVAEQNGFIVVAPDISTSDPGRSPQCWGYWVSNEIHQGAGEVEDLHQIARQVEQHWRINPDRRHITGLSSGGFMANAAAVAHNEYWASAGVHSGGGYNETAATYSFFCISPRQSSGTFRAPSDISADMRAEMDNDYMIPMMLIHSENDCAVGYGLENGASQWGGLTSNRQAWLAVNGGSRFATTDCSRNGIECEHLKFGSPQRSTLEVVSMAGLIQGTDANKGHYWSGGKADGQWTKTQGPRAADLFWDFFRRHPRQACATCPAAPTGLRISAVGEDNVSLSWGANAESDLAGYLTYRDGARLQTAPLAATNYTDAGLESARTYMYHVTAVNNADQESLPSAGLTVKTNGNSNCRSYDATLDEHVAQHRAYIEQACMGFWCFFFPFPKIPVYFAAGSSEQLGTSGDTQMVLSTLDGENFSTADCAGDG